MYIITYFFLSGYMYVLALLHRYECVCSIRPKQLGTRWAFWHVQRVAARGTKTVSCQLPICTWIALCSHCSSFSSFWKGFMMSCRNCLFWSIAQRRREREILRLLWIVVSRRQSDIKSLNVRKDLMNGSTPITIEKLFSMFLFLKIDLLGKTHNVLGHTSQNFISQNIFLELFPLFIDWTRSAPGPTRCLSRRARYSIEKTSCRPPVCFLQTHGSRMILSLTRSK